MLDEKEGNQKKRKRKEAKTKESKAGSASMPSNPKKELMLDEKKGNQKKRKRKEAKTNESEAGSASIVLNPMGEFMQIKTIDENFWYDVDKQIWVGSDYWSQQLFPNEKTVPWPNELIPLENKDFRPELFQ